MTAPPTHVVVRGVCGMHTFPPCGEPARLYPSGWRCVRPNSRAEHPLRRDPNPTPEPEETPR